MLKVAHTNLLLVALDNLKSCLCNGAVVNIKPTEIIYTKEEKCNKYSAFPHRRQPTECYSYFKEVKGKDDFRQYSLALIIIGFQEDYSECGRPPMPDQPTSATLTSFLSVDVAISAFILKLL